MSPGTDVDLVFPQWQGYALDDRPQRGARAIGAALAADRLLHELAVPAWQALSPEPSGPGGPDGGAHAGDVLGLAQIVDQAARAGRWLETTAPARLLVIGGDCGSDFAPLAWQSARLGSSLGVLYLDAHADLNTPTSSPSGRFHGMVLRTALGDGAAALGALCPRPLTVAQIVMAGTRELDAPERSFLDATGIQPWPADAIGDGRVLAAVRAHPATHWHVHLDLDVLDPVDFPEVTVPSPGGLSLAAMTDFLVQLVGQRDVVSLSVTEHAGGELSARRVAGLIAALERAGWR
jgi:arginase